MTVAVQALHVPLIITVKVAKSKSCEEGLHIDLYQIKTAYITAQVIECGCAG